MTGKNVLRITACGVLALGAACPGAAREPVDCVNTGIGSISHMLVPTFRTVQRDVARVGARRKGVEAVGVEPHGHDVVRAQRAQRVGHVPARHKRHVSLVRGAAHQYANLLHFLRRS